MPRRLVKDSAAETDLIGIWVYSFETWSAAQADPYLDALARGIGKLATDPKASGTRCERATGWCGSSTT